MKNKQLNEFDHLHVSKQAKTELLTQIQKRQAKNSRRFPLLSKVLVSFALIAKKEITEFIRKSLEEDLNLMIILINIGIKYELGTRTKVNRKRHKIQLFFS